MAWFRPPIWTVLPRARPFSTDVHYMIRRLRVDSMAMSGFKRNQRVRLTERGQRHGEWASLADATGRVLSDRERSGPIVRWFDRDTGAVLVGVSGAPPGYVEPIDP